MAGVGRRVAHGVHGNDASVEDEVVGELGGLGDEAVELAAGLDVVVAAAGLEEGADGIFAVLGGGEGVGLEEREGGGEVAGVAEAGEVFEGIGERGGLCERGRE